MKKFHETDAAAVGQNAKYISKDVDAAVSQGEAYMRAHMRTCVPPPPLYVPHTYKTTAEQAHSSAQISIFQWQCAEASRHASVC